MTYRIKLTDFDSRSEALRNVVARIHAEIARKRLFSFTEGNIGRVLECAGCADVRGQTLLETYTPEVSWYLRHKHGRGDLSARIGEDLIGVEVSNSPWVGKCAVDILKLSCARVAHRLVAWNVKRLSTIDRLETFDLPIPVEKVIILTRDFVKEANSVEVKNGHTSISAG